MSGREDILRDGRSRGKQNAMEMNVEHRIPASPQRVWEALNDVEILRAAIPGCEALESTEDNAFQAKVTTKIGPVKAKFNFNVSLTDLNPPHSYTISAEGQGGAAGFANGSAAVSLTENGAETLLAYHAQAHVGGKLAQLGARLIDGTARKLADEFFTNFCELVIAADDEQEQTVQHHPEAERKGPPSFAGLSIWVWLAMVGVAGLIALSVFG